MRVLLVGLSLAADVRSSEAVPLCGCCIDWAVYQPGFRLVALLVRLIGRRGTWNALCVQVGGATSAATVEPKWLPVTAAWLPCALGGPCCAGACSAAQHV
jgi:hypothetical protein